MIEILLAILMALGLSFTQTESGQIRLNSAESTKLKSSTEYQQSIKDGNQLDDIIITDDDDPNSKTVTEAQR
ncbi:MAG: hypothetical protein U0X76_03520 [Bacteroidia bacterium]